MDAIMKHVLVGGFSLSADFGQKNTTDDQNVDIGVPSKP